MITTTSTLQLLLLALAGTAAGQDLDVQAQCTSCFNVTEGNNEGEYTHVIDVKSDDCACVYQKIGTLDGYYCITDGDDTCTDDCPCTALMDLMIVLDRSGSMAPHWTRIIDWVEDVVVAFAGSRPIGPSGIQIGLMTFDNSPSSQFYFNNYTSLPAIQSDILGLAGGNTPPPTALTDMAKALNYLETTMLNTANGMRGVNIAKTVIFITDGVSTSTPDTATNEAAADLKTAHPAADIFAIGVGPGRYNVEQLNAIATNNTKNTPNVFEAGYNEVEAITGTLVKAACEGAEQQYQRYQQLLVQKQKPGF